MKLLRCFCFICFAGMAKIFQLISKGFLEISKILITAASYYAEGVEETEQKESREG